MNFRTPITLYLFSCYTLLTAAFPGSDLQARDITGRQPSAVMDQCNNTPASQSGNTPLQQRSILRSLCCGPLCSGAGRDFPPQSPRPPRKPKNYICRNKLPICKPHQANFCARHCECSSVGIISCGKELPARPISRRMWYKQERERVCNKSCHCELVEYHPSPGTRDLVPGSTDVVPGL